MYKKIVALGVALVMVVALSACGGKIDPYEEFGSLEELQAVLSDDFYYFSSFAEYTTETVLYKALTDTQNYSRRKRGDFKYIGYWIGNISAVSGKDLDDAVGNADFIDITVGDIECRLVYGSGLRRKLYFMIENIRYCYDMGRNYQLSEPERGVIESSEHLINSRYRL